MGSLLRGRSEERRSSVHRMVWRRTAAAGGAGADFGVASSELVLRYAQGDPVVVLASIFQHSPLTLFVRRDAGIDAVRDLAGHKVALAPWETEIFAYLQRERVPLDRLQLVQHDYSVDSLMQGRVDALAGYETDESYYLQQSGGQYRQFTPRSSGVDFYGDTLFTTRAVVTPAPGMGGGIPRGESARLGVRACASGGDRCTHSREVRARPSFGKTAL